MKAAILIRTASFHQTPASRSAELGRSRSNKFFSLHREIHPKPLRRARSDTDMTGSGRPVWTAAAARWAFPAADVEDEMEDELDLESAADEEVECFGGGMGKGRKIGGKGGGGEGRGERDENQRIGDYYQEMLRADPCNPLVLTNYGRFLHEVAGDLKGAEECYGRAILASPSDGEVLSLYGMLVWEAHRDSDRAGGYLERAVDSSPDDCYVLGSYAKFLWETEEEEGEGERMAGTSSLVQQAF